MNLILHQTTRYGLINMDRKDLLIVSDEERCRFFCEKIAEHIPPSSQRDVRMIHVYKRFLKLNDCSCSSRLKDVLDTDQTDFQS